MIFVPWCVCLLVHICITLFSSLSFKRYKAGNSTSNPLISVIIAARNEEHNLKKLLPILKCQNYTQFEVFLVLDRCTDGSKALLDAHSFDELIVIEVEEVPDDWNPKKYALSQGISKSNGQWLVFTDADCTPTIDDWLTSMAKEMSDGIDIVIGISPYIAQSTVLSQYVAYEAFITAFKYASQALIGNPYMAVGRNLAIRKRLFNEKGGYKDIKNIKGGDDDLFIQAHATSHNTRLLLGEKSNVHTIPEKSWKNYLNQKLRHLSVGSKYKTWDQVFLTLDAMGHLGFWLFIPFITTHAFFLPLLLFYLFIKLVSYRFAVSKMEVKINYMLLPFVDMLYALLTPVVAIWSKLVKDIEWKN